jgi:MarR family 2-MHQ and catechol resistance regulon transcriptional repressor
MSLSDKEYLQINQALFSLAHTYESRMAEDSGNDIGLSLSDCSVLMVLHQFAPANATQLSRMMDINPGTISVYVQRLIEKGLVQREQDADDRRNWWLTLTDRGQQVAGAVVAHAVAYTRDFLASLDESEQGALHQALLKASHSLGFDWQ